MEGEPPWVYSYVYCLWPDLQQMLSYTERIMLLYIRSNPYHVYALGMKHLFSILPSRIQRYFLTYSFVDFLHYLWRQGGKEF
jgi:hypothetical protein